MRLLVSQCRHYRGRGTNGLVPSNSWWNGWLSAIIVKKGKLLQTQDHYNDSLDWFLSNWPWTSLVMILCRATFFLKTTLMPIKLVEKMKISWKNSVSWGKWKSWLPWFQSIFRFFSQSKIDPIIWVLRFLKSKGGPFGEKNLKKIDFHVWYLKRTALKNVG